MLATSPNFRLKDASQQFQDKIRGKGDREMPESPITKYLRKK